MARRGTVVRGAILVFAVQLVIAVVFAAYWFYPWPLWPVVLHGEPRLSPPEAKAFTTAGTLVLLQVQLVMVVAVAPALAVSSVAEEKDRQTLPLLLLTQWSDGEIVRGKAVARALLLLVALSGSWPVLGLLQCVGPLESGLVATGWWLTVGTAALCTALGIYAACRTDDFRTAVLHAYVLVAVGVAFLPPCVLASPFAVLASWPAASGGWGWLLGCGYPLLQLVAAAVVLRLAARTLRWREAGAGPLVTAFPRPPRPALPLLITPRRRNRLPLPPLDSRNPILWKERCLRRPLPWLAPSVWNGMATVVVVSIALLFGGGTWIVVHRVERVWSWTEGVVAQEQPRIPDRGGWLLLSAGVLAAGAYLFPVAVGVSGAVAGERERRTLETLLATAFHRRSVLRAKVQAQVERGTGLAAVAVTAVGMAITADHGIRLGSMAAVLMMAGMVFVIAAGAWLTVRCAHEWRAFRFLFPLAMLSVSWPWGGKAVLQYSPDVSPEGVFRGFVALSLVAVVAASLFWWLAERKLDCGDCC